MKTERTATYSSRLSFETQEATMQIKRLKLVGGQLFVCLCPETSPLMGHLIFQGFSLEPKGLALITPILPGMNFRDTSIFPTSLGEA